VKKQAKDAYMGLATMDNYQTTVGQFTERSVGKTHEYSLIGDDGLLWMGEEYPHKLWTLDGYRYARVLKTVAYIVVDEDEYGLPVIEKWDIANHKNWEK
jgi:formylglycine-generating enzyme required for sulfatase activity